MQSSSLRREPGFLGGWNNAHLWAACGLTALQTIHLLARPKEWLLYFPSGINAYQFSLVFYGPAVAGISAFQGVRFERTAWLGRNRLSLALASTWGTTVCIALGVFLLGLGAALAVSHLVYETPPSFGDRAIWNLLAGLAGIFGYSALGFAIGARWAHTLSPPVVIVAVFALVMAGWIGGWAMVVGFGQGQSANIGLVPKGAVLASRTVVYVGLGFAAIAWAVSKIRPSGVWRGLAAFALLVLLVGLGWNRSLPPGAFFDQMASGFVRCVPVSGTQISACVPGQLERFAPKVAERANLDLYPEIIDVIQKGAPAPPREWYVSDLRLFLALATWDGQPIPRPDTRPPEAQHRDIDRLNIELGRLTYPGCIWPPGVEADGPSRTEWDAGYLVLDWAQLVARSRALGYDPPSPGYDPPFSKVRPLGPQEYVQQVTQVLGSMPPCPPIDAERV